MIIRFIHFILFVHDANFHFTFPLYSACIIISQRSVYLLLFFEDIVHPLDPSLFITPGALTAAPHTLKGELSIGSQYHLNMEAHAARVIPTEDGCDVFCTTQWPTETQSTTAQVLAIPANKYVFQTWENEWNFMKAFVAVCLM